MSRHKLGRVSDNPSKNRALAEAVLEKYAEEFENHGSDWAKKYQEDINKFINDPSRFENAVDKLSTWYDVLNQYRGEIKRAYAQIREDYTDALARKYRERIEKLRAEAVKVEQRTIHA
jgi:DNA repair ATPase RecN